MAVMLSAAESRGREVVVIKAVGSKAKIVTGLRCGLVAVNVDGV